MPIRSLVRCVVLAAACAGFAAAAGAQKIEVWSFIGPGKENVRERAMAQVVETFKAKNPG